MSNIPYKLFIAQYLPHLLVFFVLILMPLMAGAAEGVGGDGGSASLNNPLKAEYSSIPAFLTALIEVLLIFAIPVIVFFIIYAGFMFVTAQGDTTKIATARSALTWAVVDGVIVLGAQLIMTVLQGTVTQFTG